MRVTFVFFLWDPRLAFNKKVSNVKKSLHFQAQKVQSVSTPLPSTTSSLLLINYIYIL